MISNGDELREHLGHRIECVPYGVDGDDGGELWSVALECIDCNEVLLEFHFGDDIEEVEFGDEVNFKGIPLVCSNCEWSGEWNEIVPLAQIPSLGSKLKPGNPVPHGACPMCGELVYPAWRTR